MSLEILTPSSAPGARHRVVALKGQLETTTVPQFEAFYKQELEAPPFHWIIDLKDCEYISSAGLAALMGIKHRLEPRQGRVCIAGVSDKVMKVFKLLGLLPLFEFFPDAASAVATVK